MAQDDCNCYRSDHTLIFHKHIGYLARYMNHDKGRPNVQKYVARRARGFVAFYAARDIEAGEELRYSYGAQYLEAKGAEPI